MKIKLMMNGRNNSFKGIALYEDGKVTVLEGTKIQLGFASHIRGGKIAQSFRNNPEYVDSNGIVLKRCTFNSPSTAAQFVSGRSLNGYLAWHIEGMPKVTLKKRLEEEV